MGDARFLPGLVMVAFAAAVTLVGLLAAGLALPGARRAGLVAGGLSLCLLAPAVATAYASRQLIGLFAGMAASGSGGTEWLLDASASLWLLQRLAWGAFAAACLLGLLLGLLRFGHSADDVACSVRRGVVLLLLPALGLVLAGSVTHQLRKALRVSAAVVSSTDDDSAGKARADAVLEAEGFATRGSGSIAAISGFIARATTAGFFGGLTAVVVLVGLALPGFILAWRVRLATSFAVLSSAVWLLAAVGAGALSLGAFDPLR
jgi:hypothetical protein